MIFLYPCHVLRANLKQDILNNKSVLLLLTTENVGNFLRKYVKLNGSHAIVGTGYFCISSYGFSYDLLSECGNSAPRSFFI